VLATALLLPLMLFGFVKIAEEVSEGETQQFDERVLQMLRRTDDRQLPIGPLWLVQVAQDITSLGSPTLLVCAVLLVASYLALERKRHAMWLVAFAAAGAGLISMALKNTFGRPRPGIVPHLVIVSSQSFPSGHSILTAAIYFTLGALLASVAARRGTRGYLLTVTMLIPFLVGVTRVYLGVHYPTDVLAGWCIGLAWAAACWLVAHHLQRRGVVETPES
jgi:undecaprenyl-diphosphatase